jgi:phosphoglycerate dehydrogenase-like enzyme
VSGTGPRIVVAPPPGPGHLVEAVEAGGGVVTGADDAGAVVWADPADPAGLGALLDAHPELRWVQLPWAGVEPYVTVIRAHPDRLWTCGKGVYAEPVAEHALALALAGMRRIDRYARARSWTADGGRNLLGARVTILGGGGIARSLLRLLGPFGCQVTVVRARPGSPADPLRGTAREVGVDQLDAALTGAELAVLALALVPETAGLMDRRRLGLLAPGAYLVNVARGEHVVTDDLVAALSDGTLGGAGLDVTDPEPLPDGHPLWDFPNVVITPHTANTQEMAVPLLAARVADNVRRWASGDPLVGPVDPARGY